MISRRADPTHPFRCGTGAGFPSPAAARGVTMRPHETSFRQEDGTQETGAIYIPDSHMARRRDWSGAARVGHLADRGCGIHRQGHRRRELFRPDVEREEERSPGGESRTLLVRMRDDAGAMRVHRHDVPAARAEHSEHQNDGSGSRRAIDGVHHPVTAQPHPSSSDQTSTFRFQT
jgi:hypothetical protein